MRAARDDLRALCGLADFDDVGLDARTGFGTLVRHLFGLRHKRFDASEIEQRVTRIGLLDDAGNDVAFATRVFLVLHFAFGFTNALVHDLLHRLRRDSTPHLGRWGDIKLFAFGDPVVVEGFDEGRDVGVTEHQGIGRHAEGSGVAGGGGCVGAVDGHLHEVGGDG